MGNKKKRDAKAVIAAARRPESVLEVCLRGDLVAEHELLDQELARIQADGAWVGTSIADVNPVTELAKRIADLEQQMVESTVTFRFRALSRTGWAELLAAHPAREGQQERYNWDTFPTAIVAACLIDPAMTADEVEELFDAINQGSRDALTGAAWDVNQEASAVPFSQRASVVNRWRDESSKQPEHGASPSASSADA